jgi:hypothetical protein
MHIDMYMAGQLPRQISHNSHYHRNDNPTIVLNSQEYRNERINLKSSKDTDPDDTNAKKMDPDNTYPDNTYPDNTYPDNTYPDEMSTYDIDPNEMARKLDDVNTRNERRKERVMIR